MHTTSATLLHKLRQEGDADAWMRFTRLYSPILYYWARKMGLQHQDALDLVQEVFVVLVQKLPEFDYESHKRFRGWLWIVTKRKWLERRRRASLPLDSTAAVQDLQAPPRTGELEEAEFRDYLLRSLLPSLRGNFQESTWQAFWGHVVEGRPAIEVAGELGLSAAAVYKAKLRILAHLHREFDDLIGL
ncbi:MAG TPA: sigma-70 family RNA polymerase sigma factor [Gemmataceae bacterium]|nr:sigma-70 family RNA polymerase sigma factor [Gemmataceae bacterium]